MFPTSKSAWTQFLSDESGQSALEFAAMCVIAAALVYFTISEINGPYNPTNTVKNEFYSMAANLNLF